MSLGRITDRTANEEAMRQAMLDLLGRLEKVGERHEEREDSDVAEAMTMAIHDGFLRPAPRCEVPEKFGMASATGNRQVRAALVWYVDAVRPIADGLGLTFHERL